LTFLQSEEDYGNLVPLNLWRQFPVDGQRFRSCAG
jgi:hypothetical protein